MLESRAAYGYYGEGHGATGEKAPVTHKSGWSFKDFFFEIEGDPFFKFIEVKACDYKHALTQAKKRAKRDGFTIIGDKSGCEIQRNW